MGDMPERVEATVRYAARTAIEELSNPPESHDGTAVMIELVDGRQDMPLVYVNVSALWDNEDDQNETDEDVDQYLRGDIHVRRWAQEMADEYGRSLTNKEWWVPAD